MLIRETRKIDSPFLQLYRKACTQCSSIVSEPVDDYARKWSELEWQALWYSGSFGTLFRTTTGALVEIVQFGFWNREAGPDFIHAVIRIDGKADLEGDIELDLHVADWDYHGHSTNPAFNQVVLHLYLHRSGADHFTRTADNRAIAQVHLQKEIERFSLEPPIAHPGHCCAPLEQLSDDKIDQLIETAAQIRVERKAEHFRRAAFVHGIDEALFQSIAVALGYKFNKVAFLLLAQRAKLRDLRDQGLAAESILFGLAGFLENSPTDDVQLSNRDYHRYLWEHWWRVRGQFSGLILKKETWKFGATRPSNHPHRRLGALTELVRRWREVRLLPPRLGEVADWFAQLAHPFWDRHFTLSSKATNRPVRLIGDARINEIVANVIYPMLAADSPKEWETYKQIRSELANRNLEIVSKRLFGHSDRADRHLQFLYQQQGLLQIFEDFCLADTTNCQACRFPSMVRSFPSRSRRREPEVTT
jgi:Protein of unknown function (DUF2851)